MATRPETRTRPRACRRAGHRLGCSSPPGNCGLAPLAAKTGRAPELLGDALPYLEELAAMRETLDARYDDLKSGRVTPVNGEEFFEQLRRREDELLKRSPQ